MLQLQPPDQSKGSMTSSIPLSPCKSSYLNLQATLIRPAIYLLPLVSGGLHWGLSHFQDWESCLSQEIVGLS